MNNDTKSVLTIVGMLIAMVAILVAAYYTTRLVGRQYARTGKAGGTLRVVERIPLGRNESLCVVSVCEKKLLIGVTQDAVSMLCELPDYPAGDDAVEKEPRISFRKSFADELKRRIGVHGSASDTDKDISDSEKYDE